MTQPFLSEVTSFYICNIVLSLKKFHHAKFEKTTDYHWFLWEIQSIFVVWLLNNGLVKVAETFTDILKYYILQLTADKFAKCML